VVVVVVEREEGLGRGSRGFGHGVAGFGAVSGLVYSR